MVTELTDRDRVLAENVGALRATVDLLAEQIREQLPDDTELHYLVKQAQKNCSTIPADGVALRATLDLIELGVNKKSSQSTLTLRTYLERAQNLANCQRRIIQPDNLRDDL